MSQRAVEVQDLEKRFGDVVALDGLSFSVGHGRVVGLLGRNGSGKTTAVGIVSTALRPDGGTATVCGLDVVGDARGVRRMIGLAGQFAAVDPNLTGAENLVLVARLSRLGRRQARRRADELLTAFGIAGAADRLVRGYSGGMRRRLDLAAALVGRPPVVLLDEPTTGLDPESRVALWAMVRQLATDGAAVLLTTQYLDEADALADEVVIIEGGRVVESGTPGDLERRVGSTVIELSFADDASASAVAGHLLRFANPSPDESVGRKGSTLEVRTRRGSAAVVDVMKDLAGAPADPVGVAIREPTLDDVYFALTGQAAGAGEHPQAAGAGVRGEGAA
ncbi:MAG: ABC transporter ATP-binding protein [Acidimicrobiales bacterium]